MLMSLFARILSGRGPGFIDRNIVGGRVERAKGNAVTIEPAGEIDKTNTVTPTLISKVARKNVTRSRDLTNTWSQL
jgi:hypothetical protein